MIYQIQYRFLGRIPSRKDIDEARLCFARNRCLPVGVRVIPLSWVSTIKSLKKSIREKRCFIGEAGQVKQYAEPDLSLCDYDRPTRPPIHVIMRIAQMIRAKPLWIREDKTKHGWHLLIKWNRKFKPIELVALQCVLGSDIQRETYNLARVLSGKRSKRWNLLFEKKL